MQERHTNRRQYFDEQDFTTRKYVIPFIGLFCPLTAGMNILEIGCGEGGNLKPFLDEGCRVIGIDLSTNKINLARSFIGNHPLKNNLELICDDIYNLTPPEQKYDIVFMRDVIEHIHDQEKFMTFVKPFMHENSMFFLAFPPWQNPFGGHQQICKSRILGLFPWFHLLPAKWYRKVLTLGGESTATVENLMEVKETGISIERFERIIHAASYRMVAKKLFLINPNYEVKFRLKPVRQPGFIAGIPWLRNFLTTSVFYLLIPDK
jgi:cyclopropane fatty-acyl-phospholipid synthase-like methyltransferase